MPAVLTPTRAPHASVARSRHSGEPYWALAVMTLIYTLNVADRFAPSTLIEPIKAEFHLSDGAVGLLTGAALALFHATAGIPLGALADRRSRRGLIGGALVVWSAATALSGMAQSFWQLLLARIGVGVGEAGATPASHSLLADYFSPAERGTAMSIFALGSAVGIGMGGIGAGILEARFGWRGALLLFACAAAPLLLLLLTVREPPRTSQAAALPSPPCVPNRPGPREIWAFIRGNRALSHLLAGATVTTFAGQGLVWWTPAFLVRTHGLSVTQAGIEVGMMSALGGTAMLLATALVTIRLARGDIRRQCQFLAWSTMLITIPAVAAFAATDRGGAILLLWIFVASTNIYVGPTLSLLQTLARPDMRGVIAGIFLFAANIAGLALAPLLIGFASDLVARHSANPAQSLQIALSVSALTGLWGAAHFWTAIRHLAPAPDGSRRAP